MLRAYQVTIAATNVAQPLYAAGQTPSYRFSSRVTLLAKGTNAGTTYVGGTDVDTTHGLPLTAGDSIPVGGGTIDNLNLAAVNIYGTQNDIVIVLEESV